MRGKNFVDHRGAVFEQGNAKQEHWIFFFSLFSSFNLIANSCSREHGRTRGGGEEDDDKSYNVVIIRYNISLLTARKTRRATVNLAMRRTISLL